MKTRILFTAAVLILLTTLASRAGTASAAAEGDQAASPLADCGGEPCEGVVRGLLAFLDPTPGGLSGNGRACADCHMPTDSFQLAPAGVEARFRLLEQRRRKHPAADDPLFRPVDADDFRINGEQANDYRNLRENGLVRITFPLPPNIRLVDAVTGRPTDETFVDVWRSVPTVNDVALTGPDPGVGWARGPNPFGGYQLDARIGTLQEQAASALLNHAQILDLPAPQLLDDFASLQRVLFTSQRVRALAEAVEAGTTPLPDADPRLTTLEREGKAVFERACTQCHGGPGQSTPVPPVPLRYHDISSQCPRPVDAAAPARFAFESCAPQLARNARTYQITLPDETTTRRTSSDPGRALMTGFVGGPPAQDDWNKFDSPGLRGIRKTAPYFHNNSAASLEAVVDHYIEFFKRVQANAPPGVIPPVASTDGITFDRKPTAEERAALLAYLRKL